MKLSRGYEVSPEHVAAMFSESDVSVEAERADPEPSAARRLVGERSSAGPSAAARCVPRRRGRRGVFRAQRVAEREP